MEKRERRSTNVVRITTAVFVMMFAVVVRVSAQNRPWVTAYYAGWQLGNGSNGNLPVSRVDFNAITHVVHFAIVPRPNGELDTAGNSITFEGSQSLVRTAHRAGTKVLISVGGWNSEQGFEGASSPPFLNRFVINLSMFVTGRGYDGIDMDWEPLNPPDYPAFQSLIRSLRQALGDSRLITTTAGQGYGPIMASVQHDVNQINIMTYDLSFPSEGWVTWYNGALHQHGVTFQSTGGPVPSCDNIVDSFLAAGVERGKIGIGIEFGGSVWKGGMTPDGNGVTRPEESWTQAPTIIPDVPYSTIVRDYLTKGVYHWDPAAKASWLSIDSTGSSGDCFVSYEDSSDIAAKISYVGQQRLGGVILYELGMGYLGNGRNPLLEAVGKSVTRLAGSSVVNAQSKRR